MRLVDAGNDPPDERTRNGAFARQERLTMSKEKLGKSGTYERPIVTEIVPAAEFWRAEEDHQQYLSKKGISNCH